jgi:hypothetical protein
MDHEQETQRLREAFAATSREDVATPDCPPAERIWEAVQNELDATELRKVLHHVATCAVCTESWRLASEIAGESAAEAPLSRPARERPRALRWFGAASAAAAAVLAVVVIGTNLTDGFSTGSIARSGAAEELSLVAEDSALTRSECRPRWVPIEGATYDVQVLSEGFELLVEEAGLSSPEFLVPPSAFEGLANEAALLLRIEARKPRESPRSATIRLPC